MARTPLATTAPAQSPRLNDAALARAEVAATELVGLQDQVTDNAVALARQLGYDGSLTIGALDDQIRHHQRRTVEACMGLGASLLLRREITPHGEFGASLEMHGISPRMAQKFMSAALKFANTNSSSLLKAAGSQTKLLELVALDDDEIESLAEGGSARGITLDKLDTMTVSELKEALRQSEKDAQFSAEKRQKAEQRADVAEKRLAGSRPVVAPLDERITPFQVEITERQSLIEKGVLAHMEAVQALDTWWMEEVVKQPGYDPETHYPMPPAVGAVVLHLHDAVGRMADMVGRLQHALDERFGTDIAEHRQYLMQQPGAQGA